MLFLALAWALAVLVFATGPRRPANRLLAVILFLEGITVSASAIFTTIASPSLFYAAAVLTDVAWVALPPLYLAFLGVALESPLTRPFRSRGARAGLVAASVGLALLAVLWPGLFVRGITGKDQFGYGTWVYDTGWGESLATLSVVAVASFALVAAISAFRRAPRASLGRARARAFLLAFGLRDLAYIALFAAILAFAGFGPVAGVDAVTPSDVLGALVVLIVLLLGYVLCLAYGVLKGQLLDVEVKVKWTIRRGTVVAVFLGVFFVVFAIVEQWLQQYGVVAGGAAVGLLLFALRPIERAADRVADKAMPHTRAAVDLAPDARLAIYREMAVSAWADGVLTRDERRMLAELREKLAISAEDAERVEREVAGA